MKDGFICVAAGTPKIHVADCRYNAEQIFTMIREADKQGVKILALPELCLTGYTCADLFLQDTLLRGAEEGLQTILDATKHLEVLTADPFETMTKIRNAGAIFLGEYSSEPLGDYYAGPNHVLPTNGTVKFFSALGVDDFIKKSSIVYYSREALEKAYKDIAAFAEAEHLTAHANSVRVRFED